MISEHMVRLAQTMQLSFVKISTICKQKWIKHPLECRHLGVPSGTSKMIYEPMVRLVQTMHLSCTNVNTVTKRTETRFHMTHVSKRFQRVRPKWFLSLWYVRRKPCIHLALKLVLSPNGLNRPSTWASSPRSITSYVQNDFWVYGTLGANHAPILHWH
jgi:exoribonuclease II